MGPTVRADGQCRQHHLGGAALPPLRLNGGVEPHQLVEPGDEIAERQRFAPVHLSCEHGHVDAVQYDTRDRPPQFVAQELSGRQPLPALGQLAIKPAHGAQRIRNRRTGTGTDRLQRR
jgi:hypothetical protein